MTNQSDQRPRLRTPLERARYNLDLLNRQPVSLEQMSSRFRDLRQVVEDLVLSQEQSLTTAKATTEGTSDADSRLKKVLTRTEDTTPTIPLLQRLLGIVTLEERTHVEQCSACRVLVARLESSLSMHVRDAEILGTQLFPTLISVKPDFTRFAGIPQVDVASHFISSKSNQNDG